MDPKSDYAWAIQRLLKLILSYGLDQIIHRSQTESLDGELLKRSGKDEFKWDLFELH